MREDIIEINRFGFLVQIFYTEAKKIQETRKAFEHRGCILSVLCFLQVFFKLYSLLFAEFDFSRIFTFFYLLPLPFTFFIILLGIL